MGPGGMTSSAMSARSGSELSDSDMESSIHSQSSLAQTHPLSPQVSFVCVCFDKTSLSFMVINYIEVCMCGIVNTHNCM